MSREKRAGEYKRLVMMVRKKEAPVANGHVPLLTLQIA
jgi:hypothetical protein